jgi:hypothetical protein
LAILFIKWLAGYPRPVSASIVATVMLTAAIAGALSWLPRLSRFSIWAMWVALVGPILVRFLSTVSVRG